MCRAIGHFLNRRGAFSEQRPMTLVQLPAGHSVYRLRAGAGDDCWLKDMVANGAVILGHQRSDGRYLSLPATTRCVHNGDEIFVYGPDLLVGGFDRDST